MYIETQRPNELPQVKHEAQISDKVVTQKWQADLARETEVKSGHWNDQENAKYFAFLEKFKDRFIEKQSRRLCKIFKALSQFIKTRNPNQCRSHHHKMKKNFKSIEETLSSLKKRNPFLEGESKKYIEQLSNIKVQAIIHSQLPVCTGKTETKPDPTHKSLESTRLRFYKDQARLTKPMDFSNFPTQVSYFEQGETNLNQGKHLNNYLKNDTKLFSQSGPFCSYNSSYLSQSATIRDKGWMECHQIFTKWLHKVQALIN